MMIKVKYAEKFYDRYTALTPAIVMITVFYKKSPLEAKDALSYKSKIIWFVFSRPA